MGQNICYNNIVMERKVSLFVSRKNPLTWLMALCLVGSAVARIVIFSGMEGVGAWSQIVLPIAACLLYVLITILNGKEMFYKTAIPVWMAALYSAIWIRNNIENRMGVWLFWVALFFFASVYTDITAGHRKRGIFLLVPLVLSPVAFILYFYRDALMAGRISSLIPALPDLLMLSGVFLLIFALRIHTDGAYHPTWGDRIDGRRIRSLAPMEQISAYFQVERNTCSNLFEESFEITPVERYIRQKRREGLTDFGILHVLLAAYVRGVAKYPQLNRFISGQKIYSHGSDIQYCMTVKKEMSVDSPDTTIKVHLTPGDTAADVYHKLSAAIEEVKSTQELDSGLDNLVQYLNLVPSVVLKFTVWLLKLLDYFGLVPGFLLELSPFHGSLFFTSMGSLGIRPVYHHLYDFGNLPVFGAFGCKRKALELQEDGSVVQRKYIDCKFTLDERIADGYYYATFFKYYRRLLRNPEILDQPPEEIVQDVP